MTQYNKAIAAAVTALVAVLATQGIDIDPEVEAAVVTLATTLAVWLVPNKGAA